MINKILPLLNHLIPAGLAYKGLQQVDPRIGKFLGYATAAGYGTNQIIDFLRSEFSGQGQNDSNLRPDEQATKTILEQQRRPVDLLKKGAVAAASLGAGGLGAGLGAAAVDSLLPSDQAPVEAAPIQITTIEDLKEPYPVLYDRVVARLQKGGDPRDIFNDIYSASPMDVIKFKSETGIDLRDLIKAANSAPAQAAPPQAPPPQAAQPVEGPGQKALMEAIQNLQKIRGAKK